MTPSDPNNESPDHAGLRSEALDVAYEVTRYNVTSSYQALPFIVQFGITAFAKGVASQEAELATLRKDRAELNAEVERLATRMADLKKPLLPHELKLIARLLDYASAEFCNSDVEDTFELADTKRHRDMKIDIAKWNDWDPSTFKTDDRDLMSYMAHRVREVLEEEG